MGQLRENIAESKLSYEIMDDAAQAFLKVKIMDNIHKYYYLIVFTAYMREMAEVARTTMTDEPKAALTNLEKLASGDFKGNLGKIIHDIYQTAHIMLSDMPQGDHKKRAKYRFASKTLMRILPAKEKAEVEGLIEKKTIT